MIRKTSKIKYILVSSIILIMLLCCGLIWKLNRDSIPGITGKVIENRELEGLELSVEVPEKYQRVQAGEMLQFEVTLKNIQKAGRQDIQLDYYIKKNEITIVHRRELKAVETQASFLSSIKVPEETLPGIYNIEVEINEEKSSLATFYVKSSDIRQIRTYLIILVIAIIIVGTLISWELHRLVKKGLKR